MSKRKRKGQEGQPPDWHIEDAPGWPFGSPPDPSAGETPQEEGTPPVEAPGAADSPQPAQFGSDEGGYRVGPDERDDSG